jgi:hypothetical protein
MEKLPLDNLTSVSERLILESASDSVVSRRSQKAVQRLTIRVRTIQHWCIRDKRFQRITLVTNRMYIMMLICGSYIA